MSNGLWNREELYKEIWESPMRQVAKRYGISDVALAKTCRKLNIPVPPRGYWARKQSGVKAKVPALGRDPGLRVAKPIPRKVRPVDTEVARAISQAEQFRHIMSQPVSALPEHPTVKASRTLEKSRVDERGMILPTGSALDIRVTKTNLKRALLFLDQLFKRLEAAGAVVKTGVKDAYMSWNTKVYFAGEGISIAVLENAKQSAGPERFFTPSGKMRFEILDYCPEGIRAKWKENTTVPLDSLALDVALSILACAFYRQSKTEERRRAAAQREQQLNAGRDRIKQLAAEQQQLHALESLTQDWRIANLIRDFAKAEDHSAANQERLEQRLKLADRLDPLTRKGPSIKEEMKGILSHFPELQHSIWLDRR